MPFQEEKHGYNKTEVDFYVSDLEIKLSNKQKECERLKAQIQEIQAGQKDYQEKSQNITVALTAAVEKARQIEGRITFKLLKIKSFILSFKSVKTLSNSIEGKIESMSETL